MQSSPLILLVIALYAILALVWFLPSVTRAMDKFWRTTDTSTVLIIIALAAFFTITTTRELIAKSGTTTNPTPDVLNRPRGVINLYIPDAANRLIPIGAPIKEP